MKIEIIYKNKDLEVIGIEEFTLNEYCHLLSQKTLSLLYQIEDFKNDKIQYSDIKKYIFNLAGSIQRLPDNLVDGDIKESKVKKPDKSFFDFLLRRDS
jgi:hypothetical protein